MRKLTKKTVFIICLIMLMAHPVLAAGTCPPKKGEGPGSIGKQYLDSVGLAVQENLKPKDHMSMKDCIGGIGDWGAMFNLGLPNLGNIFAELCKMSKDAIQSNLDKLKVGMEIPLPDAVQGYIDNPSIGAGNGVKTDYSQTISKKTIAGGAMNEMGNPALLKVDSATSKVNSTVKQRSSGLADALFDKMRK